MSIQASYPNQLGSITVNPPAETIQITWVATVPVKQVLLAWAGQRVLLEHDWRIPAGEDPFTLEPNGSCPFVTGAEIHWVKSAEGPGNFIPGARCLHLRSGQRLHQV